MGKVYNVPLSSDFPESLALFIKSRISMHAEPCTKVFLPNRLSCIVFRQKIENILNLNEYQKKFLKIYSVSDELFIDNRKTSALVLPVLLKNSNFSENSIDTLYGLSGSIAEVIRNFILNDINFSKIHFHLPEDLQEYWKYYQTILNEVLKKTEIDQYIKNCKTKLQIFLNSLSNGHIIAADITALNYCTLRFLKRISDSENGEIIFQGSELKNSENYFLVKKILRQLNIPEYGVVDLCKEMLIKNDSMSFNKVDNENSEIQFTEFNNISEEASAIAIAVRQSVYKKQSVIVISNDDLLTEKISSELKRWNIMKNSSSETELSNRYHILFSGLLDLIERKFKTSDVLKFLKMFPKFRPYVQETELIFRKTEFICPCFFEAFDFLDKSKKTAFDCENSFKNNEISYQEFCTSVTSLQSYYSEKFQKTEKKTFLNWMNFCIGFLKIADLKFTVEFEKIIKNFLHDFLFSYPITFEEFAGLCRNYVINKYVMNFYCYDHDIILSTADEAQFLDADFVIIAGANTENWNISEDDDTWMTCKILRQFYRDFPIKREEQRKCILERFLQKKNVLITRSKTVRGEQQLPVKFAEKMTQGKKIIPAQWLKKIVDYEQTVQNPIKIRFSAPTPAINLRPCKFSATGIKLLHDNPYDFYAKYILKLRELNRLDEIKNMRGNFIHDVLENFVKNTDNKKDLQELINVSENILQKMHLNKSDFGLWFFRLPRLLKFVTYNSDNNEKSFTEIEGKINFEIAPEKIIYLTAKADRIDMDLNGAAAIIDYKTGAVPSVKDVKNFDSPQLLIESLIYINNGFNIPAPSERKIDSIAFWVLNEPEAGGKIISISNSHEEIENLTKSAADKLKKMLIEYNVNGIAYDYNLKYTYNKCYAHLARKKEWSDA